MKNLFAPREFSSSSRGARLHFFDRKHKLVAVPAQVTAARRVSTSQGLLVRGYYCDGYIPTMRMNCVRDVIRGFVNVKSLISGRLWQSFGGG